MKKILMLFVFGLTGLTNDLKAFDFPTLPGPFSVGTASYHLKDENRPELFSYLGMESRELMIQIWYPCVSKQPKPSNAYMENELPYIKDSIKKRVTVPMFVLNYLLKDIYTHAQLDAAILPTREPFPVLIFSHGFGSLIHFHSAQLESLASYGYVVVGINHTYDCCVSVFPPDKNFPRGKAILFNENHEPNPFRYTMERIKVWIQDVQFVLDQLKEINNNDPKKRFTGKLDLNRIGMFGHSMGGATTTQMCRLDDRIKAGVNMDGPLLGENAIQGFNKPFMFLLADQTFHWVATSFLNYERADWGMSKEEEAEFKKSYLSFIPALCCNIGKNVYSIVVKNTDHNSFSDIPLLKQVSVFFRLFDFSAGSIEPKLAIELSNMYLVTFFDKFLKGRPAPLLDTYGRRYSEDVIMQKWQ